MHFFWERESVFFNFKVFLLTRVSSTDDIHIPIKKSFIVHDTNLKQFYKRYPVSSIHTKIS